MHTGLKVVTAELCVWMDMLYQVYQELHSTSEASEEEA
jgi:hypothetical protein